MARASLNDAADYQVAWIATLPMEKAAAMAMFDERHEAPINLVQSNSDTNSYTFGRIGEHNVVVASLPSGATGVLSALRTSLGLVASFPHIRIGLLVGIASAIPENNIDIRLGDVVVSQPQTNTGGVIQYDARKALKSGEWQLNSMLARPPAVLLAALGSLQAEHYLNLSKMSSLLERAYEKEPKFASLFQHPGSEHDQVVAMTRGKRNTNQPYIHYGTIANGSTSIENAARRREIFSGIAQPCICFEMEAGGVQNDFPCLVIRGISDYADENKNDLWQTYASATAAAFAKELLMYLPRRDLDKTKHISEIIKPLQKEIRSLRKDIADAKKQNETEKKHGTT